MRLGLFGGSFDPVHFGHLLLAECCREQCRLDQVWFVPAARPPHKQGELTPGGARIEMLQLAIGGHAAFSVCPLEIERAGTSYTVDTLESVRQMQPQAELFFLMGGDSLADLPQWKDPRRICELALPVVVRRPQAAELDFTKLKPIASPDRIAQMIQHVVEMPQIDLSSRDIRRRVGAGESIRYRTPRAVEKYIEAHRLYGSRGD